MRIITRKIRYADGKYMADGVPIPAEYIRVADRRRLRESGRQLDINLLRGLSMKTKFSRSNPRKYA